MEEEIKKKKGRPKKEKVVIQEPIVEEIVIREKTIIENKDKDLDKLQDLGFPLNFIQSIYNIFIGKK